MTLRLPWMSRSDRRRWRAARTLADLGELMAQWLGGEIASWPGYQPNYGPDDETKALVPTLAACNRAGYVTIASQPGEDPGIGLDGLVWSQRAAVEGFVRDHDLLRRLADAAYAAGLEMEIADQLDTGEKGFTVTTRDGRPHTTFGGHLSGSDLRSIWPGLDSRALDDVFLATRVTLTAPEYGTAAGTRLWEVLDDVTGRNTWSETGEMATDAIDLSGRGFDLVTPVYTRSFTHPGAPETVIAIHHYGTHALGGGFVVLRSSTISFLLDGQVRGWTLHEIGTLGTDNVRPTQDSAQDLARRLTEQLTGADIDWNGKPFDTGGDYRLRRNTTAHLI
ncbi:hypothetical protein AB0D87_38165 [Streptomyces sp. NPDC048342]|uniref:DUF6919 domain-containing protein n=1 Tax=unclassified Streptomyces TaxID=2593676 RepID=UPI0034461A76